MGPNDAKHHLIEQAKRGHYEAFERLVEEYRLSTYHLAYQCCGNRDDALDICQEVFVKLFQNLKSYKAEYKFENWLYRIVHNAAIDFHRRGSRHQKQSLDGLAEESHFEPAGDEATPDRRMTQNELAELFRTVAAELPPNQRLVFVLKDLEGKPSLEVAEIIEATEATVRSHLHAARKKIKEIIQEKYPEFLEGLSSEC